MTRPGVPPFDGECRVCEQTGFRDSLQFVNHVAYIHQDEPNQLQVERETLRALAHFVLGPEAEETVSFDDVASSDDPNKMECPLCTALGGSFIPILVQHGRKNHSDEFEYLAGQILRHQEVLDAEDLEGRSPEKPPSEPSSSGGATKTGSSTGTEGGGSPTIQVTESTPPPDEADAATSLDRDLDDVLGSTEASQRREELAEDVFRLFLDRFAIDYEEDEHGVLHAELPRRAGVSGTVEWQVAFDKEIAKNRHVDFINYTNPEFQRILRHIQSDPVLAIRLIQEPENPATLSDESSYRVLRTDFSFHVEYRTYGQSREELIQLSQREAELGEVIVTDAFQPKAFSLPETVKEHYRSVKTRLMEHLSERVASFCQHARKRRDEEEETLEKFEHKQIQEKHGTKQLKRDEEFYRSAIERYRQSLDEKYEVTTEVQLLTIEPYLAVEG